jgi:hypothetical protein
MQTCLLTMTHPGRTPPGHGHLQGALGNPYRRPRSAHHPQSAKAHDATIIISITPDIYASCKSILYPLYQYDGKLRKRSRLLIGGSGISQSAWRAISRRD